MVKCQRCGKELGKVHHQRRYCRKCAKIVENEKQREYVENWHKKNPGWKHDWNKERHRKNLEKQNFLKSLPPDELLNHVRRLM